jgi:hypothetical protein
MKKQVRLYNVLFPVWMFYLYPTVLWLLILPANFIIDSLVIYFSARKQGVCEPGALWRKKILPAWIIGFCSDFVGGIVVFLLYLLLVEIPWMPNLILFPGTTLVSIPGVVVAGFAIYWLNRLLTFRKSDLEPAQIHKICLHLALFTAPYTFLIPLYG